MSKFLYLYYNYIIKKAIFFTCNLPKTLMSTPPSNIGCESIAVIIRFIF